MKRLSIRLYTGLSLGLLALILVACQPATVPPTAAPAQPTPVPATPTLAVSPTATALPAPTAVFTPVPGTLYVNPQTDLGPISPYIYGSNYGPWVALPVDMIPAARESGVTIIRFPGGEWGDMNDVQSYHVDMFMDFLNSFGAKATISVRLKHSTPDVAVKLMQYVNGEKGYDVRYWSIGNEPTLYAAALNEEYDTTRFNKEWREFALAMKAADPNIQLLGPEINQFTGNPDANLKDSSGRDWMIEFLKANGDLVDVVTFHRYPFPTNSRKIETVADLRENTAEWDQSIIYLRGLIHEITGREIPIGITEMNTHYTKLVGSEAAPDSHYNAIWLADVLGRLIRQNVFLVNQWMLYSQGGQGGWGIITRGELRPSYYTYQLYKQFGTEQVYASSDNRYFSIYAATRQDGALTLMLVNLADDPQTMPLIVEGKDPSTGQAFLLDPTHKAEPVDLAQIFAGGNVTLPGQSVVLLVIP